MMNMVNIQSNIEIARISESSFQEILQEYNTIAILTDEHTSQLIPLLPLEKNFIHIQIQSGEEHKNLNTCQTVWDTLNQYNISRNSLLINLGGGVITDLGGFVASTYKRGIDFVNVPTTLLAMIDASVGGKTGVNFNHLKNNIGVFVEAQKVYCDIQMLKTLPSRELNSGIGEIFKHALIKDQEYWQYLKNTKQQDWDWNFVIRKSIEIKSQIVAIDPLEKNERKKLNFGHTFGHALESWMLDNHHFILHGEAVAWGLEKESLLSYRRGFISKQTHQEIKNVIQHYFDFAFIPTIQSKELIPYMLNDKKNNKDTINCTLLTEIGQSIINQEISINEINNILSN